jgi:cytidylate kinase
MESVSPLVVSISRQKGCGGAYLGQKIAKALGISYLDRELIAQIARQAGESEDFVEEYDERLVPVWDRMIEALSGSNPWAYTPPPQHMPAFQVCELESEAIIKIAKEKSVVVVGRGASYLLRNHPKHASIFLYASKEARNLRTQEVYKLSGKEARSLNERADVEREKYTKSLSGFEMCDARQYHLSLDTGVLGLDNAESIILQYISARFPEYAAGAR